MPERRLSGCARFAAERAKLADLRARRSALLAPMQSFTGPGKKPIIRRDTFEHHP